MMEENSKEKIINIFSILMNMIDEKVNITNKIGYKLDELKEKMNQCDKFKSSQDENEYDFLNWEFYSENSNSDQKINNEFAFETSYDNKKLYLKIAADYSKKTALYYVDVQYKDVKSCHIQLCFTNPGDLKSVKYLRYMSGDDEEPDFFITSAINAKKFYEFSIVDTEADECIEFADNKQMGNTLLALYNKQEANYSWYDSNYGAVRFNLNKDDNLITRKEIKYFCLFDDFVDKQKVISEKVISMGDAVLEFNTLVGDALKNDIFNNFVMECILNLEENAENYISSKDRITSVRNFLEKERKKIQKQIEKKKEEESELQRKLAKLS